MNKGLLLLVALWALIAIVNARPLMFFADQTDAPLGLANGWAGIAYGFVTLKKGQNDYRIRIFAGNNINETIVGSWLQFKNGTKIDNLAYSLSNSTHYVIGDTRLNTSIFDALLLEEVYITVASTNNKNGAISGYFRCRPQQGMGVLNAAQIVGTTSNNTLVGLGWAEINVGSISAGTLPQDISAQDAAITASSLFNGRVIFDATGVTAVSFNAPANTTAIAPILANGTLYGGEPDAKFTGVTVTDDFYSITTSDAYYKATHPKGNIRGQIYALLTTTRRSIPYSFDTVNGVTGVPAAGFGTLRYANQELNHKNANSYVSLQSVANPTNFTYLGVVYFHAPTNRKNADIVRGYTVEMNALIAGTGTWLFEFFDSVTGEFLPVGTLTTATEWTPAYIDQWTLNVNEFANSRDQLIMRVSVNSAVQSTLFLDLFGIRAWTPSSDSNTAFKEVVAAFDTLPAKFANGTVINS